MKNDSPAISIIIPMYNVEKYIAECLDSILAQTFTDYEIIVVDDGSKDRSCEIVESYLPKFEGKLQLIHSEKNSGGCVGIPRNKGIKISRGKYLYFVDSDDALLENTLEIFYNAAENFQADFVHAERWFNTGQENIPADRSLLIPKVTPMTKPVERTEFLPDGVINHVKLFTQKVFLSMPWLYFMRRNLVVDNDIKFPETRMSDDQFFDFCVTCYAKKILRIPDAVYICRQRDSSVTHEKLDVEKNIHRWAASLMKNVMLLDNFMNRFDELRDNGELKYSVFERFYIDFAGSTLRIYSQTPAWEVDKFIRRELDDIEDKTALTAFLFTRMNILNLRLLQLQQAISQKDAQIKDLERQLSEAYNVFTR